MKITKVTLAFLVFQLLLTGCLNSKKVNGKYQLLDQTLSKVMDIDLTNQKSCIIIPKSGCTGCIQSAIDFVKYNINKMNGTHVIFTGITDMKLLKMQLGKEFMQKPQVHIDEENLFKDIKLQSAYPQILWLKDGLVDKIVELNTADPAVLKSLN